MAYVCSICELWIHKTCASLPLTIQTNHHHHRLSLAFCFPIEHRNFRYKCDICDKEFYIMPYWVYYCGDCRYFAHVKCVTSTDLATKEINIPTENADGSNLIQLPVHDISKELIAPFIIRARENNGLDKIPDAGDMPPSVIMPETKAKFSLLFNYHKHPLSLVSEGAADADDELKKKMMICDACVTPIHSPPYYSCATCNKYFLHSTCYFLPKALPFADPQLYGDCPKTHKTHKFTLYTGSETFDKNLLRCMLCELLTNGMVYECEECKLIIDVKCAALPTTIKYASHQQHKLIMRRISQEGPRRMQRCEVCGVTTINGIVYCCTSDNCDFALDLSCAILRQSIRDEKWDKKHPLLLTCDASVDHPTDFYCDFCERQMHPKSWMYHCRECDLSFHTKCLTASGDYRNVKFGRQFDFDHRLHPHPLTFNQVTLKLRCDICRDRCCQYLGFECASCDFVCCRLCGGLAFYNFEFFVLNHPEAAMINRLKC